MTILLALGDAYALTTSSALAVARRDWLFEDHSAADVYHQQYDVLPDGKRFVVLRPAEESPEVVVVLNWLTELRALGVWPRATALKR